MALVSFVALEAQGDAPTLSIVSDGAIPTTELLLSPPELEGDPRAQVGFTLEGIHGGDTTAGSLEALSEVGVSVTLHCPEADGHAGVEVPFDSPSLCEVDVNGAWVVTHERVVLISGISDPSDPEAEPLTFEWEMLRLGEDAPIIPKFDPKDTMVVRDVGMTDHFTPKVAPMRRI